MVFIVFSYQCAFILIALKMKQLSMKSKNERNKIPVYFIMLIVLIVTQLIYLMGYFKLNWYESHLVSYFLFSVNFIYLFSIAIGHVYLRRFIID